MRTLRIFGGFLVLVIALAGCSNQAPKSDVGIQLFMYNWNSVAKECEVSLGPAGISWVLVSPPQEHIQGEQWWVHYQPVSYQIESRLGTRAEFQNMVDTCKRAGVEVIADAVINHMAGSSSGSGWAGSSYDKYDYPGLYNRADFHSCGLTENNQIANFADRAQVQNCELLGLSDLDTGSKKVRERIISYLKDLISLGVAGFRIDAAKHIAADDLEEIISSLPSETKIYHEVIRGAGEDVQPEEYLSTGRLWEFSFSQLMTGLDYEMVPNLEEDIELGYYLPSEKAISFVTNHDTERNGKALTNQYSPEAFKLASLFMLASDYGTPMLYSGYFFDAYDQAPPVDSTGRVIAADCEDASLWHCQQRDQAIVNMIKWRAMLSGLEVSNFVHGGSYSAWSKAERGFFALNASLTPLATKIQTSLPAGSYCNILNLADGEKECPGKEIRVQEDGSIDLELQPLSALALLRN